MEKEIIREVQGLEEFPSCLLTVNDEHAKQIYNIQKIFETSSNFHVKWRTSRNINFCFSRVFC